MNSPRSGGQSGAALCHVQMQTRLCEEALPTVGAPAHAKHAGHALARSLVHAVIFLSRPFSSLAGCPRRSLLTCCKAEGKKEKEKEKKNKNVLTLTCAQGGRAVLLSFKSSGSNVRAGAKENRMRETRESDKGKKREKERKGGKEKRG